MMWTAPAIDRKPSPDLGDERAVLEGWLDYHRDTLLLKCSGLTEEQLKTPAATPSDLTLLGLVRHMTELERWLRTVFTGEPEPDPYSSEASPDGAFDDVAAASAAADLDLFRTEVELTRKASSLRTLDDIYEEEGETLNVRSIVVHILEEYARHNGHADIVRQNIDGATGA